MIIAMDDTDRFGLVLVALWGGAMLVAFLCVVLAGLKERFGALPRGLRWTARLWPATKRQTRRGLLRVFYPEVAQQERNERVGYTGPTLDKETAR